MSSSINKSQALIRRMGVLVSIGIVDPYIVLSILWKEEMLCTNGKPASLEFVEGYIKDFTRKRNKVYTKLISLVAELEILMYGS